jgi:hypothetical protein
MKYANTVMDNNVERVVTVLPLERVPLFDPEQPPEHCYVVPDAVCPGWVRTSDGIFVPPPSPVPVPVPSAVTMRQARLALLAAGLLDAVETALTEMEGDAGRAARIEWEYATEVRHDNPLFSALAAQLGLTGDALDALFVTAAGL